jgi:hypothetical protein
MSMIRRSLVSATLLGSLALAACGGGYNYNSNFVAPPPPAPYAVAAVGYGPGPGYVWTGGYWDLHGGRWAWADGAWVRPPHARAAWIRPYWEPRGRGYRFHRGYWR